MKKLLITLTLISALLITCLASCTVPSDNTDALKANAAAVFTLDVNPGVRVYVDADNAVITVEATNEDGEAIVAELDVEGKNYEDAVEKIIDAMTENGYVDGETGAVLISIEKKDIEISEKINEKINKAFEKHGKKVSVIEQELDEMDEELKEELDKIAEKHHISRGKAQLIEKIREEFPELSEEELASLKVGDLGVILDETSEHVKEHFKKLDKPATDKYIEREAALDAALASLELKIDDVAMPLVRITREDGKMVYEVRFVNGGMSYEITLDAETAEILSSESEEYVEIDPKEMMDEFFNKHGDKKDHAHDELLSRGELLKSIFEELEIPADKLDKIDVRLHESKDGAVYSVTVKTESGDVYKLVVEAFTGSIIKAECNGTAVEIPTEETPVEDTPVEDTPTEETPAQAA